MVIPDGNVGKVQYFCRLLFVGAEVFFDLLPRKWLPQFIAAGRVSDHRGEASDNDDYFMSGIDECLEFAQRHGVAQVELGSCGVDAPVDPELLPGVQFFLCELFWYDVCDRAGEEIFRLHVGSVADGSPVC